jgi:hypothetical protein
VQDLLEADQIDLVIELLTETLSKPRRSDESQSHSSLPSQSISPQRAHSGPSPFANTVTLHSFDPSSPAGLIAPDTSMAFTPADAAILFVPSDDEPPLSLTPRATIDSGTETPFSSPPPSKPSSFYSYNSHASSSSSAATSSSSSSSSSLGNAPPTLRVDGVDRVVPHQTCFSNQCDYVTIEGPFPNSPLL